MSEYFLLNGDKKFDFRYNKDDEYVDNPPSIPQHPFRKKNVKRETSSPGKCPSCGMLRSRTNKCFCNED
jgi:hypothetical protein